MKRDGVDTTMQLDRSRLLEHLGKAAAKAPCLLVIGGLDVGRVIPLQEGSIVLGREEDCDIVLRDDGISRFHTEVRLIDGPRLQVRDLDSTNGTYIAGERIRQGELSVGDKLLLGRRTVLKFELQDELEQDYQRQLYDSVTRDGLTGAFNRKHLDQQLDVELSFSRRHTIPLALMIFDLDHFKRINDTFGHQTGDEVLRAVCREVRRTIRAEDLLARYGGEEFAIVSKGIDINGAQIFAERVRAAVARLRIKAAGDSSNVVAVTISIGVAVAKAGVEVTPQRLVAVADENLYHAKREGRDRVIATRIEQGPGGPDEEG